MSSLLKDDDSKSRILDRLGLQRSILDNPPVQLSPDYEKLYGEEEAEAKRDYGEEEAEATLEHDYGEERDFGESQSQIEEESQIVEEFRVGFIWEQSRAS